MMKKLFGKKNNISRRTLATPENIFSRNKFILVITFFIQVGQIFVHQEKFSSIRMAEPGKHITDSFGDYMEVNIKVHEDSSIEYQTWMRSTL